MYSSALLLLATVTVVYCGVTDPSPQEATDQRIIGGRLTTIDNVPYIASILVKGLLCGGSVVTEQHIVTAAHCLAR